MDNIKIPLLCNSSVNELSTMERPFSLGSVPRGYLEDNWSDPSSEQLAVGRLQVNARRSEQNGIIRVY
jgi:hypothetical protein